MTVSCRLGCRRGCGGGMQARRCGLFGINHLRLRHGGAAPHRHPPSAPRCRYSTRTAWLFGPFPPSSLDLVAAIRRARPLHRRESSLVRRRSALLMALKQTITPSEPSHETSRETAPSGYRPRLPHRPMPSVMERRCRRRHPARRSWAVGDTGRGRRRSWPLQLPRGEKKKKKKLCPFVVRALFLLFSFEPNRRPAKDAQNTGRRMGWTARWRCGPEEAERARDHNRAHPRPRERSPWRGRLFADAIAA